MPILVNKNTTQQSMASPGRTGTQSVKWIPAPRVYVKPAESISAAPVEAYYTKSNGITPTGWTDLGTIDGDLKVTYEQKTKEVRTGIDNILRAAYLEQKGASLECSLSQTDDVVLETISGVTASVIIPGSVVNYQLGTTDMNQLACLFVVQNKLNGKEFQYYNPNAYITFSFEKSSDSMVLKMTGLLPSFIPDGGTNSTFLSTTVFA